MTITIIGIGLIGGSMAITLKENGFAKHIIGVDRSQENLDKAIRRRIIDEDLSLEEGIAKADLIIVSTPVNALKDLLPLVLDKVDKQVVMDVGSTKEDLLLLLQKHPKRMNFVATHPMAGTEYSGPEAAVPNLFNGHCTVLCDIEDSSLEAANLVRALYESMDMGLVYLDAKSHDVHCAYVSHISHISSFALAITVLEKEKDENRIFELASSGFGSTVRLAKSSPEMWVPIFKQNRDNVMDVLDEHINTLAKFRSMLIKKDFKSFAKMIEKANSIKKIID